MGLFSRASSPTATQMPATGAGGQQAQAPLPGQYFDVPGVNGGSTQWTEQDETTPNLTTQMTSSNSVQVVGILPYRQTDVVVDWAAEFDFTLTYTAGAGQTLAVSPYAPFNLIGQVQQVVQNQYSSVNVENGVDLYIFNLMRPERKGNRRNNLYANPAGSAIGGTAGIGYWQDLLAQANQVNTEQWSTASTTFRTRLRLPAAQWFDSYYDLAVTGEPVTAAHPALVSPQFQAGTTRVITPSFVLNSGIGTVLDAAPVHTTTLSGTGDTASTFTGQNVLKLRRHAVYAGNPAFQPPVYAWQYRWQTKRFGLSGVSTTDILIPLDTGQLMACYVRMFDPAANGGLGAPILPEAVVKSVQFQYGSGLFWFNGTPMENQMVWLEQHGFLMPEGVFAFDFALDERDGITNKRCLNTLTTGGMLVHIEFTTPCSASAYAVLGTESLVYVV